MVVDLLTNIGSLFSNFLSEVLMGTVVLVPKLIMALLILIFGYLIASLVGWLIVSVLDRLHFDKRMQKACHVDLGKFELSDLVGSLAKWSVFLLFLDPAMAKLIPDKGIFVWRVIGWLPHVIAGVIVILAGVVLAQYVSAKVHKTKIKGADWFSRLIYWTIIVLVGVVGLGQIGINTALIENIILLVVGAMSVGLALALGISLGLGLKDDARGIVKQLRR